MTAFARSLRDKHVIVVGLGRSGVAAASACLALGARVTATDGAPRERLSVGALALEERGVGLVDGGHSETRFDQCELVVVSPGVPSFAELRQAESANIEVIGEIELAFRILPRLPTIAITGSNGKSTTTTLVGQLLHETGLRVFVGGNIGIPPCELPIPAAGGELATDVLVLEVSSFQCERMPTFAPSAAALLNVSANHLDRYAGFDDYVSAKGNLFAQQNAEALAVVPADDPLCIAQAQRGTARQLLFGPDGADSVDYGFDRETIVDFRRNLRFERKDILLAGDANAANICASLALVADFDIDPIVIRRVLASFAGLPHRNVRVGTVAGVSYYDDSKATSVGAAVAAVRGLAENKVVLIAGGRDKLGSYLPLVEALRDRGRALVLIGEAADRIAEAVGEVLPMVRAESMQDAVAKARALAHRGDAVLLSPACSSFDMFRDYAERGEMFARAVLEAPSA